MTHYVMTEHLMTSLVTHDTEVHNMTTYGTTSCDDIFRKNILQCNVL